MHVELTIAERTALDIVISVIVRGSNPSRIKGAAAVKGITFLYHIGYGNISSDLNISI